MKQREGTCLQHKADLALDALCQGLAIEQALSLQRHGPAHSSMSALLPCASAAWT